MSKLKTATGWTTCDLCGHWSVCHAGLDGKDRCTDCILASCPRTPRPAHSATTDYSPQPEEDDHGMEKCEKCGIPQVDPSQDELAKVRAERDMLRAKVESSKTDYSLLSSDYKQLVIDVTLLRAERDRLQVDLAFQSSLAAQRGRLIEDYRVMPECVRDLLDEYEMVVGVYGGPDHTPKCDELMMRVRTYFGLV